MRSESKECDRFAGAGIQVWALNRPNQTVFQANSIHDSAWLGFDLGADRVTLNDAGDADFGANLLQSFPIVTTPTPKRKPVPATGPASRSCESTGGKSLSSP